MKSRIMYEHSLLNTHEAQRQGVVLPDGSVLMRIVVLWESA